MIKNPFLSVTKTVSSWGGRVGARTAKRGRAGAAEGRLGDSTQKASGGPWFVLAQTPGRSAGSRFEDSHRPREGLWAHG